MQRTGDTKNAGPSRPVRNPPPDPNPRKTRHAIPPNSWDCHIHLFGPASQFPFAPESPYFSDDALPEDYFANQTVLGLAKAVVVSAGGYGTDYSHLRSVLERFNERLRGIILSRADLTAEEVTDLARLGVRGVRMFGAPVGNEWEHLPRIDARVAAMAHELGLHVCNITRPRATISNMQQTACWPFPDGSWLIISACSIRGSVWASLVSEPYSACSIAGACGPSCLGRCVPRARRNILTPA